MPSAGMIAAYHVACDTLVFTTRTLPSPMHTTTAAVWKLCRRDLSHCDWVMPVWGGASQYWPKA